LYFKLDQQSRQQALGANSPDIYTVEIGLNRPVNIMLTPTMRKSKMFEGLKSKVIIENVQELIENEKLEKSLVKSRIGGEAKITWDDYYNYKEVKLA
jgi:hypothetical protein